MTVPDYKLLRRFEKNLAKFEKPDSARNFAIIDAMLEEAIALKVLPSADWLAGIETAIRWAKATNVQRTS